MNDMNQADTSATLAVVVETELRFSFSELCRASRGERARLLAFVDAGVLEAEGQAPEDWLFNGASLQRARVALRLADDFGLDGTSTALVLDLLDRIDTLQGELRRAGLS